MRKTRKAGKLDRVFDFNAAEIVGAGGFGIIARLSNPKEIVKLLYDSTSCEDLKHEARIQQQARRIIQTHKLDIQIPEITYVSTDPVVFNGAAYLCGIGMTYLPPPLDFTEAVHIVLGNSGDLDCEWGRSIGKPVSLDNPTRGFFASPETAEWIWAQEGSRETIDSVAYKMGKTYRVLLENGIIPIDLEWVWSSGKLCLLDFGLCEFGTRDHLDFLQDHSRYGLASEFYWPPHGWRGHDAFLRGYLDR
jgi:hypothetical protein